MRSGRCGKPVAPVHDLYHNEEPTTSTGYLTDEITAHAEAFIEQRAAGPFFVEVAYNATHWPFQRPDLAEGQRGWTHVIEDGTRADYVAMLERADQGVGRILDLLDKLKLSSNTLVIFTSDNGGEWLSRNAPLFHRKSTLWEGGIRVPLLMRWPGRLRAGTVSPQVGITMDLTASILAAAGATPPPTYRPEGIDLVGVLQKGTHGRAHAVLADDPTAGCRPAGGAARAVEIPAGPRTELPVRPSQRSRRTSRSRGGEHADDPGAPRARAEVGSRTSMPKRSSAPRQRRPRVPRRATW